MSYRKLLGSILTFLLVFQCTGVYAETEQVTYVHSDHLGSPILGRDANGQTVFEYDYRSYGARDVSQGEAGFVGYTGHGQSDDSGLLYARARWIDPVSGRFLSSDPVLFNSGGYNHFNRYAYTYNNPYTMVDPDGEHPVVEGAVVAVVVGIVGRYLVNKAVRKHVSNKVRKKVAQELSKKKIAKEASEEVTKSSRKRVKRLVKNLSDNSRQNNGLSQEKTDQLRRIVEKTGGKLRSDGASGVKGSSAGKPHVQTEGLGKSIDSRHIWTKEGVQ